MFINTVTFYFLGVLKVEGEIRDGAPTPPPNQDAIPNLANANFYVGGVPPGFKTSVTLPGPFLGCMSDLQVAQEGYNLLKGQFWGVQASCSEKVTYHKFVHYLSHRNKLFTLKRLKQVLIFKPVPITTNIECVKKANHYNMTKFRFAPISHFSHLLCLPNSAVLVQNL